MWHQQGLQKNLIHFIACQQWLIPIEEIANLSSGPKTFSIYIHKDQSITDDLLIDVKEQTLMVFV